MQMHPRSPAFLVLTLVALGAAAALGAQDDADDPEPLGPPPLYDQVREAEPEAAGRIRDGRLRVDRFAFELDDGDLYLFSTTAGRITGAVYLGRGTVRVYPPDGVEHQQLKKLADEDFLEEEFERFVFWFTGDEGEQLRALADGTAGRDARRAANLLADRREELLENQLANPDGRVLMDLWRDTVASLPTTAPYFFGQIDTRGRDWLSIEIEPRDREEVSVTRYDGGRRATEVWMGFHALAEFDENVTRQAFAGFPRDPEIEGAVDGGDDDDWNFRDFGLPARTQRPTVEHWTPRARVQRTDADLALEGDGDASATAAIVVEALVPLAAVRVQMSQLLEVTDVRWRPEVPDGIEDVAGEPLLGTANSAESAAARPDEPAMLSGEPVHFVQAEHDRRVGDDLHEPWLTVLLPRMVEPGERFIVEMAYEGELVEQLRSTRDFLLRDTVNWLPRHPDNRLSRFGLTFRVPDQYRVTSGGTLVDDRVEDGTRIMRWVTEDSVHDVMAFHYGRFDVSTADAGDGPPLTVYANRDHLGFAPGNRQQTLETLRAALQAYSGYFGPYPFRTLTVTETPAYGGQAFPGLVLLSFEAFGDMNSDEAAFFRAHEVAHQWWGASVNWEDYRDQWISEGFAHYSAALFVLEARDARGEFDVMMETWRRDILSEVTLGTGTGIARYGLAPALVQRSDGHESGPVVAGYRLATPENPMDYQLLAYEKGAFILHMLRAMLTEPDTDDDARFRAMMLGFATDHAGGVASTVSFEAAVEAAVGEPVDWFFDQWVYGTDVPTYRPDLEIVQTPQANAPFALRGTIVQEDVPPGFRMPVPITLTFDGFPARTHIVWVDAPEVMVDVPLPARPTDIEFNSGHAVLARVR